MKLPHRRQFLHLAVGAAALPAISLAVRAQTYPSRPVRFIVPFPPGGPSDVLARIYGQKLSQRWNQPVVVENRIGATGTIGAEAVVRAPPDGYTLLFTFELPITMAPALLKLRYDPERDVAPIAMVAKSDNLLAIHPSAGIRSVADLVAAAKSKPGTLTFASAGNASPSHLCGEMLKRQASIDLTHVPYPGVAPAMNAILSGNVTMFCGPIPQGMALVKAGKLYALGVTSAARSTLAPEVAPLSDTYPDLIVSVWVGLFAAAGTPASVRQFLRDELKEVYADPDLQQRLADLGLDPEWMSGAELTRKIKGDTARWAQFIKAANIKPE